MRTGLDTHSQKLFDDAELIQKRYETLFNTMSTRIDHMIQRSEHYEAFLQRSEAVIVRMEQLQISIRTGRTANTEFMINEPDKAIEHADRATELLKKSVAVHEAEMRGEIEPHDAQDLVIRLNRRAIDESTQAIELFNEAIDPNAQPTEE